jgi:preprotein translocase subunit SecE
MPRNQSVGNPAEQILQKRTPSRNGRRLGIFSFFGEVIAELKKVTWPTREEATRLTVLVLCVSITIGIILGLIDFSFSRLFEQIL